MPIVTEPKVFEVRPTAERYSTVRLVLRAIAKVLLGSDSPGARFTELKVIRYPTSGDPESSKLKHLRCPATEEELDYCRAAWMDANLEPIENSRRAEREEYKKALAVYREKHPRFPSDYAFVLEYRTTEKSQEDFGAFHARANDVVGGMMAVGDIELQDSNFLPTGTYSGSKLLSPQHARAVYHRFGLSNSFEQSANHADLIARTPTQIHLSGDFFRAHDANHVLHHRRYQVCLDAGFEMPTKSEENLPVGIAAFARERFPDASDKAVCMGLRKYIRYLLKQEEEAVRRLKENRPVKVA